MFSALFTPLDSFICRLHYGPVHRFTIARRNECSYHDVEELLCRHGIRILKSTTSDLDGFAILIERRQAVWAEYLLCRAGIRLTCRLLDVRNESYRHSATPRVNMPKRGQRSQSCVYRMVDHMVDWIERLLD